MCELSVNAVRCESLGAVLDLIREFEAIKEERTRFDEYASSKTRLLHRNALGEAKQRDPTRLLREEAMRKVRAAPEGRARRQPPKA
jgi:hypothetical protein